MATNFKENTIFNIYKEDIVDNAKKFKSKIVKKYNLNDEQVRKIYVDIVNYQIDKYGQQKLNDNRKFFNSTNECLKKGHNSRQRRYGTKKYREGRSWGQNKRYLDELEKRKMKG